MIINRDADLKYTYDMLCLHLKGLNGLIVSNEIRVYQKNELKEYIQLIKRRVNRLENKLEIVTIGDFRNSFLMKGDIEITPREKEQRRILGIRSKAKELRSQGYTMKEIATISGISTRTAYSYMK